METFHLKEDLNVLGFQVKTFPTGIGEAFDALIEMLQGRVNRAFYGISYASQEGIVYLATAVENYTGEAERYNCEQYTIVKGEYLTTTVRGWRKKTNTIKDVFGVLLQHACPDTARPCVEWYKDDDEMLCMVRIDPLKNRIAR
jgi:hypothetical protein